MLYEMRTYLIPSGRMDDILKRFESVTFKLFEKYDMEVLGFWTVSKPADKYALVYLMRYADEAAQEKGMDRFPRRPRMDRGTRAHRGQRPHRRRSYLREPSARPVFTAAITSIYPLLQLMGMAKSYSADGTVI